MNKKVFKKAIKHYNQLWKHDAPELGQKNQPTPTLTPVKKGGGYAYMREGENTLYGSPKYLKGLGKGTEDFTTRHEWGHIEGAGSEGHANRVANLLTREERGKLAKKMAKKKIRNTLDVEDG